MDNFLKSMGERLLQRRKQYRLSQEELAEIVGISPQAISTAELGKKAMRPENIVAICKALDMSTDYLLTGVISEIDKLKMLEHAKGLTENQMHCLEEIIKNYVNGCRDKNCLEADTFVEKVIN